MKTITINEKEIPVYCTVQEADEYFEQRFNGDIWNLQSEENKKKLLVTSTKRLNKLKLQGFPCSSTQPLLFPRYFRINWLSKRTFTAEANAVTIHGKELIYIEESKEMADACCEEALNLINNSSAEQSIHIKNQKLGIQSVNIQGQSVSYNGYGTAEITNVSNEALSCIDKFLIKSARVV